MCKGRRGVWRGRSPLGVPFVRAKGTKTRLGRSPLRTSLGGTGSELRQAYVRPVTLGVAPVPASTPGRLGQLALWLGWFPGPGLRLVQRCLSHRREPGHRQLGTAALPGKGPGGRGANEQRSRQCPQDVCTIYVTPPQPGPKPGDCRGSKYRGVDSTRRGKAPPLAILSCLSHRGERHPAEQIQADKSVPENVHKSGLQKRLRLFRQVSSPPKSKTPPCPP